MRPFRHRILALRTLLASCLVILSCSEQLPTRIVPESPLTIADVAISQGTGDDGIQVTVSASVRNDFDETFDGVVAVTGELHIWWPRRPDVEAHIPLSFSDQIRLAPGQKYRVEQVWSLTTDDGRDVLDLLVFSAADIRFGVVYAQPETFVASLRMTVFRETGLLSTGPREFTLQGWRVISDDDR
ncbi:MAG: hypothetical protein O2782_06270 [bacterium]|nr:hypothetical protein [bacterium]